MSSVEYTGENLPLFSHQFRKIPDDTDVSADHSHTNPLYVKDDKIETYWYSGKDSGNLRLLFSQREWISIMRLYSWYPRRIEAKFYIRGKEYKSDRQWVDIGERITTIDKSDPKDPQPIDIDVNWNQYELIQIQCIGCPVINQIEIA